MEKELRKLKVIKEQIEKGFINFKKSPKDRINHLYINTRLELLENQLNNFSAKYDGIVGDCEGEELFDYFQEDVYEKVYDTYLNYKVDLKNVLLTLKSHSSNNESCDASSDNVVRLPKIVLPTFSGKYTEWSSFRDLFISLVHNNKKLDDVQRLHYLKTQLSGEAEQLIRHIPITETNYKKCWEMLEHRFNNRKFMSTCILKRLFSQRNIVSESSRALKDLLDVTSDCLHELTNIGIDVSSWDVIIVYVISLKLDAESRKQWELHVSQSTDDLPSFKQFCEFLETRFRALEFVEPKSQPKATSSSTPHAKSMHSVINVSCPFCSADHKLANCKTFSKENIERRREIARNLGVCFNCLRGYHTSKLCRVLSKCRICQRKHHTLLHPKNPSETSAVDTPPHESTSESEPHGINTNIATHFVNGRTQTQVLLATALIKAESQDGSSQVLRALLDQGSQASFITEAAAQLLRLKKVVCKTTICGIGGPHGDIVSKHIVKVNTQSLHEPAFNLKVTAHVLSSLTSVMPDSKFEVQDWPELCSVNLADPNFNVPNKIDMILGAEIYCYILKEGLIKNPIGSPIAQNTQLGWIVSGHISKARNSFSSYNTVIAMHTQIEENEMLKQLWELDSEPAFAKRPFTPEEQACENFYTATTKRNEEGRYVVKLPFRSKDPLCKYGHSKNIAVKRLIGLERKLSKDVKLKQQYSDVINEYLRLGHLEKIVDQSDIDKSDAVYLPHHAVVRQDKLTTKVRVVYDASCKGTNGVSLNDTLMVGPTLQADLRHIVMRWRQHPICLAADIIKMYRQIMVAQPDTDYQRIVWREDPSKEIEDFRLLTVTFGTSCAPYLAVKSLHQIACDEGSKYPMAASRVMTDFYVDDLMTGCQSETDVARIYSEMNSLLEKGGFQLQKWTSNRMDLLEEVQQNLDKDLEIKVDKVTKILGLTWNRNTDEFDYSVRLVPPTTSETKRTVISEISRLYDPLGWIAPSIITAKVFIQKLWIAGIGWDDELTPELLREWKGYKADLEKLVDFHLPRWIGQAEENAVIELHGFSDASSIAYAAVVYCRIVNLNGEIRSHLITAKTKVAPIKQISIPRLELCGAVLVTKLLIEVSEVMNIPKTNIHAWTDSSVVLAWLSDHPSRWKTFVANRTSIILSSLDSTQWAHVQSKDNPADIASRGTSSAPFLNSDLWKQGPSWLRSKHLEYTRPIGIYTSEERKTKIHTVTLISDYDTNWVAKFSSLRKLIRLTAYCKRFLHLLKRRATNVKLTPYLSVTEIREALDHCIKQSQQQEFHAEILVLKNKLPLEKKSPLYKLNIFLDDKELLRVGSRLRHAPLHIDTKHPIVIPHESCLARLIIADAHVKTFHGGQQLMLNFIRTRYWICRLKNMVRAHIRSCIQCIRQAATTKQQMMGDLPTYRVTPCKPFLNSGVDYAGPISMKVSKGRGQRSYKGYICLFVCMVTRAIHIEAVSDLTTTGFLAAFKRFVSRRGHCRHIWSDNGTNFVGAAKELKALFKQESTMFREIAAALANSHTEWHFIPPHAPNFGGLWEAGIKSVKYHLSRVVGNSMLTFEEMSTLLSQIEACLNSRPLSQCSSSNPDDPTPLTPGHFLIGQPLVVPPDCNFETVTLSSLRRWQLVQRMMQHFWRRWKQEYLTHFFQRQKWATQVPNLKVGDIVLVKEENLPPAKWLYGRIIQLHPGKDNLTRVVTISCKGTTMKRPTSKLCLLPVMT